ncbi:MAG: molybdopterin-binding/glycosyltransferase family 2 protein [Lentilitoribacter sp.]
MKFGEYPIDECVGHVLAHSLKLGDFRLSKGTIVTHEHVEILCKLGQLLLTVAIVEDGDFSEDEAAKRIGTKFNSSNILATTPVAGRVNLIADCDGVLLIKKEDIDAFNDVDETITIASLAPYARVQKGMLLATIKIIPYGVTEQNLALALQRVSNNTIAISEFEPALCDIILTETEGFKQSLLKKGEDVLTERLRPLKLTVQSTQTVSHDAKSIAQAMAKCQTNKIFVLGASATSDRNDVIPSAIVQSGGKITRFGMPVDPGNLLLLAEHGARNIIGMPGCVRAPALNGADWVLERLAANVKISSQDIARMGVGGLLKEISQRPLPRATPKVRSQGVAAIVLAAGSSRRMGNDDKLFRQIKGQSLLRRSVTQISSADISTTFVVVRKITQAHHNELNGLNVQLVEAPEASLGMSASMRAGILAAGPNVKAYLICLADMPDITNDHINAIIKAHDPVIDRNIVRPMTASGEYGHPVLFDGKYYEDMTSIEGDTGAKSVVQSAKDQVYDIEMDGAITIDLDTPRAWTDWLQRNGD